MYYMYMYYMYPSVIPWSAVSRRESQELKYGRWVLACVGIGKVIRSKQNMECIPKLISSDQSSKIKASRLSRH